MLETVGPAIVVLFAPDLSKAVVLIGVVVLLLIALVALCIVVLGFRISVVAFGNHVEPAVEDAPANAPAPEPADVDEVAAGV